MSQVCLSDLSTEALLEKKAQLTKSISKFDNMQYAKKVQLNSAYGALGNQYFRYYDVAQAEAVTLSGQLAIRWIEKTLNKYLNKILKTDSVDYVIAIDTDSVYLSVSEIVQRALPSDSSKSTVVDFLDHIAENKLQKVIDRSYQRLADYLNCYAQKMYMKRECICDRGIWTAKKRYALNVYDNEGVRYETPKLKIMGLEVIKTVISAPCKEKLKESLRIMMSGTESELQDHVKEFRKQFYSLKPEEIAFPRGVNGIEKYSTSDLKCIKGTPMHVRAAINFNRMIHEMSLTQQYQSIRDGDRIKFVFLSEPNPTGQDVIAFSTVLPREFGLCEYIDYARQFEKSFVSPLQLILDKINWSMVKRNKLF